MRVSVVEKVVSILSRLVSRLNRDLACKGLLRRPESPDFNKVSDRSTVEWKTNDLKAIGVIAGDVSLTYQVYIREALTAAETWMLLKEHSNKKALKNWLLVTKKLHSFMIKPSTMFAVHVDKFKNLVLRYGVNRRVSRRDSASCAATWKSG
ncbi:hypothetical protein F443_03913 [Phytophthora nicotianae P1569]|uniref:Uncharacterized protein n=1 Tax=Phytophthora nicotianae P1569 TaxID=1317065 RepID=V9FQN2_PHYNI|nr:hypothetical protein F443_03913 [Phytophthora nicotianae P1569]